MEIMHAETSPQPALDAGSAYMRAVAERPAACDCEQDVRASLQRFFEAFVTTFNTWQPRHARLSQGECEAPDSPDLGHCTPACVLT